MTQMIERSPTRDVQLDNACHVDLDLLQRQDTSDPISAEATALIDAVDSELSPQTVDDLLTVREELRVTAISSLVALVEYERRIAIQRQQLRIPNTDIVSERAAIEAGRAIEQIVPIDSRAIGNVLLATMTAGRRLAAQPTDSIKE